jgi:ubiquinone/menaquinone biosynthesis C-methylase UbiE
VSEIEQEYDRIAEVYDGLYHDADDVAENQLILGWLHRQETPILDLGCGTGLVPDLMKNLDPWEYAGIDISVGMLDVARRKHPSLDWIRGDMADANAGASDYLLDESFGCVVSLFSLGYHDDPLRVLDRAYRALRQGGRLLVVTPGAGYDRERFEERRLVTPISQPRLEFLGRRAGFEIARWELDGGKWSSIEGRKP